MLPVVATLNYILALGTIGLQVASVIVLGALVTPKQSWSKAVTGFISQFAFHIALAGATAGLLLTLLYSEYFGFIPCGLCWVERIFLYPQVVLLAIALVMRDRRIFTYILALSLMGAVVALYHHYLQMGGTEMLPCPASGNGDCGKRILYEFNYVTYPLMAFALFVWQALVSFIAKR